MDLNYYERTRGGYMAAQGWRLSMMIPGKGEPVRAVYAAVLQGHWLLKVWYVDPTIPSIQHIFCALTITKSGHVAVRRKCS
jgi:hypothetical protein